jgi:hypothetical protein
MSNKIHEKSEKNQTVKSCKIFLISLNFELKLIFKYRLYTKNDLELKREENNRKADP